MREVFPPPVGPTRRNVGREVAAWDLNTNRWRNKGVRKITTTAAINTGSEGLKSEVKKEWLGSKSSSGAESSIVAGDPRSGCVDVERVVDTCI